MKKEEKAKQSKLCLFFLFLGSAAEASRAPGGGIRPLDATEEHLLPKHISVLTFYELIFYWEKQEEQGHCFQRPRLNKPCVSRARPSKL